MSIASRLKQELWSRYGTAEHPAEWDGNVMGGGKISQRFWEYFITLDMLDLPETGAVVLDIGGGNGFLAKVLTSAGVSVVVVDKANPIEGVMVENCFADHDTLTDIIRRYHPTHIACASVMEHASEDQQRGIFQAIEEKFSGEAAVFTFEFHETTRYFEQQITTKTMSNMVSPLRRYYLDRMERSPIYCINAVDRWYPLALRFIRSDS